MLLNRAGSLVTRAVLKTLGPYLGKLLLEDHSRRRAIVQGRQKMIEPSSTLAVAAPPTLHPDELDALRSSGAS